VVSPAVSRPADVPTSEFVSAMGNAATGVTVVATDGPGGRFAQTVSAMCSVSADPPTVLVCVHQRSPLVNAIRANEVFAVSVLSVEQVEVAEVFAGRSREHAPYDFGCAEWTVRRTGSPLVRGSATALDCRLQLVQLSGTHRVFFGLVDSCETTRHEPVTYLAGRYGRHRPLG
jgi:flavin reductase